MNKFKEDKHSEGYLRKRLNDLLRAGYLGSVGARGLYYIIPQESSKKKYVPDKFLLGAKLSPDGAISYHSVLELHGVSYSPLRIVYILTQRHLRSFRFQGMEYRAVKGNAGFGIETILRIGLKIPVTDQERTLVDGINGLKYVGGLEEYFKNAELFPSINFDRIIEYLARLNRKILYAKVGFLLSYFEKRWGFPGDYRKEIKTHLGARINYLSDKQEEARLNKEWRLMVPVQKRLKKGRFYSTCKKTRYL